MKKEHDSIRIAFSTTALYVLCGSDRYSFGAFQEGVIKLFGTSNPFDVHFIFLLQEITNKLSKLTYMSLIS